MASSGAWYRQGTVTVTNGSASITGVNTDWLTALIAVAIGDIFTVDSKTWYEIVNVSADTGITLDRNFEGATVAGVNYAIIRNTSGTVLTRIAGQVAVQFNQKQLFLDELRTWLNSTNATEMVTDSHGVSTAITTPTQMASEHSARVAQVDTLVNGISAMTKAEFFALAEQRKSQSAGSGFINWGKHSSSDTEPSINEGMNQVLLSNTLRAGRPLNQSPSGLSLTSFPVVNVNGFKLNIRSDVNAFSHVEFKFPSAPDGTKTYDSSTGTVTQHASAAIAFAAETATNKVITSRQDFVFIEPWHEKISDKDVVYPLGNVQYGASAWEGVTLSNTVVAQGYSAFGEWDTVTKGYGVVWSTLSDANKVKFIQDHKNNIYSDNGELIQVRYRVRVVEGLGDSWEQNTPNKNALFRFDSNNYIIQRGKLTSNDDFSASFDWGNAYVGNGAATAAYPINGQYSPHNSNSNMDKAHNGLCFAIPIALVQRRNQGAYHPVYNSEGTGLLLNGTGGSSPKWYGLTTGKPLSLGDCFNPVHNNAPWVDGDRAKVSFIANGSGFNGRPDGKFCDAIYASDVKDLRMSSVKKTANEILKIYDRKDTTGGVRGFEGVPFTKVNNGSFSGVSIGSSSPGGTMGECWFFRTNGIGEPEFSTATTNTFFDLDKSNRKHFISASDGSVQHVESAYTSSGLVFTVRKSTYPTNPFTGWELKAGIYFIYQKYVSQHEQANPTWTDIIGSPENIAATFPDGVEGQWIPQIPDGVISHFNLNRKGINSGKASREYTNNNGDTWSYDVLLTFNATSNLTQFDYMPSTQVMLYHYETKAHFTQDDVNSKVLSLGGVNGITANDIDRGNLVASSLIGKICTGYVQQNSNLIRYGLTSGSKLDVGFWDGGDPEHSGLNLTNNSPAVKTLNYLSSKNGVAKLCYAYKEMVYDSSVNTPDDVVQITNANVDQDPVIGGIYSVSNDVSGVMGGGVWRNTGGGSAPFNSVDWRLLSDGMVYYKTESTPRYERVSTLGWGDNNKFEIADYQNTMTDDNGNSVLHGTASFETQYFIGEE